MRRSWRSVEVEASRVPRGRFAPAAVVARAVGALAIEAATYEVGAATTGAVAGCAPGVARMVDVALARLVLDALPGRAGAHVEPSRPVAAVRPGPRRAEGAWPQRARLPQPAWWGRESPPPPYLVGAEEDNGLGPLWPRVPEAPRAAPTRTRTACGPACDRRLLELAWRTLEQEIEPADRRLGGGR